MVAVAQGEFRAGAVCLLGHGSDLRQLMNGQPTSIQPEKGQQQSSCTYTVDAKPTFRGPDHPAAGHAGQPVPVGNGSATANAKYTFAQQRQRLGQPPKHTPPATIMLIGGVGDQAFSALQTFR